MKINKTNKQIIHRKLLIAAIVLISFIIVLLILELTSITNLINPPSHNQKTTTQQDDIKNTTDNNKQNLIDSTATPSTYEPTVDDIIISANRETNGVTTIHTQLANYSDGLCDITITNGNNTYTNSAAIIYQSSYSTCAGFSIPSNTMPDGIWQITLSVVSKGITVTKTISVDI